MTSTQLKGDYIDDPTTVTVRKRWDGPGRLLIASRAGWRITLFCTVCNCGTTRIGSGPTKIVSGRRKIGSGPTKNSSAQWTVPLGTVDWCMNMRENHFYSAEEKKMSKEMYAAITVKRTCKRALYKAVIHGLKNIRLSMVSRIYFWLSSFLRGANECVSDKEGLLLRWQLITADQGNRSENKIRQ